MNKLNTKIIIFGFGILAILAFNLITFSTITSAEGGYNYVYNSYTRPITVEENNSKPAVDSVSPSSSNIGVGVKTVTIIGEGFVPNSIARINGSNRPTTFIDSSHLLMQVTGNDTSTYHSNGGFFITVFNPAPGGGYSNAVFFTINNIVASTTTPNIVNDTSSNFTDTTQTGNGNDANSNSSNLTSNAIFGSNGFLPSGLIQWIFFAILVLLIVILARRIYGGSEKYHATPLKHN